MSDRSVQLILGGPGTGKTSHFIGREDKEGVIGRLLTSGVAPSDIAYVSFTRKAADEAAERASQRFGFERDALPHFRTIHSMSFQQLNMKSSDVMQRGDYREIATLLGVTFTGYHDPADGPASPNREGDVILQWMAYARARQLSLREIWQSSGQAIEWALVKLFSNTVEQYKRDLGKTDFSDMLDQVADAGLTCPAKIAIIDEAQDLSTAQWRVARSLFRNAEQIYLGGDDDQAIHSWAGADVEQLFRLKAERMVLPVSHRLPKEVFDLATNVASRIQHRFPKDWEPASHSGHVYHVADADNIDLRNGESWMLLARNRCFTTDYVRMCREQGVTYSTVEGPAVNPDHVRAIIVWERLRSGKQVTAEDVKEMASFIPRWSFKGMSGFYTLSDLETTHQLTAHGIWHDALSRISLKDREYYAHCLRNGFRLQERPLVHIGTIHSVKGGEADNVVIRTDMTYRTAMGLEQDPDNEHRVFYTGITRARKNLFIVDPQEGQGYLI